MRPGDRFRNALQVVTSSLATTELHWTGGEPTLNRGLAALTAIATEEFKLSVKMTSNGELGARKLSDLAIAGLTGINFSIFGTTPSELTEVQAMAANDLGWAARKINDVNEALDTSIGLGLKTGANIVVRGPQDIPRVLRIVDSTHTGVQLRLQADLDTQREGWTSIYSLLSELGAHPESANISAGTSDAKITYRTSEGRAIIFKRFMSARLPESCTDCRFNNDIDCKEGYYGVRLYISDTDEYKLGICLRRMDLTVPLPTFVEQGLADEISAFRDTHRQELEATASDVLINRMRAIL
jgi:cyclic pyranopterin phosphate synthase